MTSSQLTPFHLAIPVDDLEEAKQFYHGLLGADIGRSDATWIDFNFFGHQLVCHLSQSKKTEVTNPVDNHDVPVPHFGLRFSSLYTESTTDRRAGLISLPYC